VSALGLDCESVVAETILDHSRLMTDRTVKADQILRIELIGQNGAAMTFVAWNDCCAQLDIYINCVEASATRTMLLRARRLTEPASGVSPRSRSTHIHTYGRSYWRSTLLSGA
jgi:hypothetical protein